MLICYSSFIHSSIHPFLLLYTVPYMTARHCLSILLVGNSSFPIICYYKYSCRCLLSMHDYVRVSIGQRGQTFSVNGDSEYFWVWETRGKKKNVYIYIYIYILYIYLFIYYYIDNIEQREKTNFHGFFIKTFKTLWTLNFEFHIIFTP